MSLHHFRYLLRQNQRLLKLVDEHVVNYYLNGRQVLDSFGAMKPLAIAPQKFIYPQRCISDTRAYNLDKSSIFEQYKNRFKLQFKKYKLRSAGFLLYESIADNIDYPGMIREFNLPDTFHSWFVITELHVWLLMVRLMADGEEGRFARNCLVEALWQDVTTRSKKLGSEHASVVRKQVIVLNEEFQAALVSYDEGLLSNDRVLANALWRRFFNQDCDNAVLIEAMVKYTRQTMFFLDRTNSDELIFERKIRWITLGEIFEDLPPK